MATTAPCILRSTSRRDEVEAYVPFPVLRARPDLRVHCNDCSPTVAGDSRLRSVKKSGRQHSEISKNGGIDEFRLAREHANCLELTHLVPLRPSTRFLHSNIFGCQLIYPRLVSNSLESGYVLSGGITDNPFLHRLYFLISAARTPPARALTSILEVADHDVSRRCMPTRLTFDLMEQPLWRTGTAEAGRVQPTSIRPKSASYGRWPTLSREHSNDRCAHIPDLLARAMCASKQARVQ